MFTRCFSIIDHQREPLGQADLLGARPVVVIAQHRKHRGGEPLHQTGELIQIELAVADEIAGHHDEVRLFRIHQCLRLALDGEGRDPADMQVGHVGNSHVRHRSCVSGRPREPPYFDSASLTGCDLFRRTRLGTATRERRQHQTRV